MERVVVMLVVPSFPQDFVDMYIGDVGVSLAIIHYLRLYWLDLASPFDMTKAFSLVVH